MITWITEVLTELGTHLGVVTIGCVEVVAAVILTGKMFSGKRAVRSEVQGAEKKLLDCIDERTDEAYLLIRRRDQMPVYTSVNFETMTGLTLKQIQDDVSLLNNLEKNEEKCRQIRKDYQQWSGEEIFREEICLEKNKWTEVMITRSRDGNYEMVHLADMNALHYAISEYEEKLRQAEESSQSKTSFLSRMSHEIRTPMNGIIGMLTLAKSKVASGDPVTQYLEKAEELSDHMLSLLNDILDMSRIEAGKVELEEKPFSLKALGRKLYDMFGKNLEERGIRYEVSFENMTRDLVIGDELRISQVVINFLSNAVKFTSEGEITVTFRQMMLKENRMDLLIRVHDTGIGMSTQFISHIFSPFEQESIETGKKYGGSGLGMAITDQIVKLMGGEIVVESIQGEGSDFFVYLHLPVADQEELDQTEDSPEEKETDERSAYTFQGRRILLAEDNDVNAMIAMEILQEMGADTERAADGKDAVTKFREKDAWYYDFILMDVQMPVLDGRSAAKEIRGLNREDAKEIPIFALSADAFVEDKRLSLESGMNGHFAKPVDFVKMQDEIGRFLKEKR